MSNGDDEAADDEPEAELEGGDASFEDHLDAATEALSAEDPVAGIETALDEAEAALGLAETEADLDALESTLDDIEDTIADADLPEPDDDEEEGPRAALESRLSELREGLEDARGPYAEDVISEMETAKETIADAEWTEQGEVEVVETVSSFAESLSETLDSDVSAPTDVEEAQETVIAAIDAVESTDLDPDEDADTIAALLEATDALTSGLDEAQTWDDLTVREQLQAEGFYDVLDHRKDFPPEWHALKVWEKRGNADMVLLALENLESDFMERHCLEALRRMGAEEAIQPMLQRANRRDQDAIEILGKIGSEEPVDTLLEYAGEDTDDPIRRTTLTALGEIGTREATQPAANALAAENPGVRSTGARALGMIGDARAIEPLENTLGDEDEEETVRASAAWALVQIGTEDALTAAAEHADDRSYLVQSEAAKAVDALGAVEA